VKSQKALKRETNEVYAERFKRRSKQRRKAERTRRIAVREARWMAAYNRGCGDAGRIEMPTAKPRATSTRRRGRRRA
jgi:hypothetical protein